MNPSSSSGPLRLGLLGLWHPHAAGIVRQIAAHPDEFRLVGCWDQDGALVEQRQREWLPTLGPCPAFASPEALLKEPLDAIVVEGRVFENVALARQAVEAGYPVLLEKPGGENLRDFEELLELAGKRRLHVQMLYLFRYMSAVREMLRRGQAGEYGDIYEFRARLPKDLSLYDEHVADLGRYSGGIFFEMAGHMVDMAVTLLGRPRKVTPFLRHHHTQPGDFIDHGIAILEFPRAFAILEVPALEVAPGARRFEVYGTRGACVIPHLGSGHLANNAVQPVEVFRAGAEGWERLSPPAATLQIADLREFAAVVRGQKPPEYSPEHDRIVQETLLAASGMR